MMEWNVPGWHPSITGDVRRLHSRDTRPGPVSATFFGTSTILVRDDATALLVDGFFTRPSLLRILAGTIAPDRRIIRECLSRAGVDRVDAVLCAHAHYDHAMDSAVIAEMFDAPLLGSESVMNIGRGHDLPSGNLWRIGDGDTLGFGAFKVGVVESPHSPGDTMPGTINAPLRPPARVTAWRSDACYSFFFTHAGGVMNVHAGANFSPGMFADHRADTVYLGVGALGRASEQFREQYWHETVHALDPHTVLPIHWDNFTVGPNRPLRPLPYPVDNLARTLVPCRTLP